MHIVGPKDCMKKKSGSGYKGEGQINSNGSVTDQVYRKKNHKTDPLKKNYEDTSGPRGFQATRFFLIIFQPCTVSFPANLEHTKTTGVFDV